MISKEKVNRFILELDELNREKELAAKKDEIFSGNKKWQELLDELNSMSRDELLDLCALTAYGRALTESSPSCYADIRKGSGQNKEKEEHLPEYLLENAAFACYLREALALYSNT